MITLHSVVDKYTTFLKKGKVFVILFWVICKIHRSPFLYTRSITFTFFINDIVALISIYPAAFMLSKTSLNFEAPPGTYVKQNLYIFILIVIGYLKIIINNKFIFLLKP